MDKGQENHFPVQLPYTIHITENKTSFVLKSFLNSDGWYFYTSKTSVGTANLEGTCCQWYLFYLYLRNQINLTQIINSKKKFGTKYMRAAYCCRCKAKYCCQPAYNYVVILCDCKPTSGEKKGRRSCLCSWILQCVATIIAWNSKETDKIDKPPESFFFSAKEVQVHLTW